MEAATRGESGSPLFVPRRVYVKYVRGAREIFSKRGTTPRKGEDTYSRDEKGTKDEREGGTFA